MFERPCEVLIRRNAEIEWAENQIKEKAERMAKSYNELIGRGFDPLVARAEYSREMKLVCDHFMPVYRGATPHMTFTLSFKA